MCTGKIATQLHGRPFRRLFETIGHIAHGFWSTRRVESVSSIALWIAAHLLLLFCWPNTPLQRYFYHAKLAEKEPKKSSKRSADGKNESSSLSRPGKCYDTQKTLNLSQRTVGPKLGFGSGRVWVRIWLTKTGNFWSHSRISL